eukprot:TRINITY_DN7916_c0_g1_i1.p1 TRINITY_DN7916_c0_g1~~TRINITY_DN7916_c0_g1_i1.p1  ORF type:complete len:359 (+),score=64.70 TRINITY_DN7916_c0_g1_i1:35-1111(+)
MDEKLTREERKAARRDALEKANAERPKKAKKEWAVPGRMKGYEAETHMFIDPAKPYVMRLDGHAFSKFTKHFKKPYDPRILEAMVQTTIDLMTEYHAVTGYTQSDEISIVFPALRKTAKDAHKELKYGGRILKICTLAAGYCSTRFIFNLMSICDSEFMQSTSANSLIDTTSGQIFDTHFDSRVFNLPNEEEVVVNLAWRTADVLRNSKNNLGHFHFKPPEMFRLSPKQVLEKLQTEKGVNWHDMPAPYRCGVFVKRERYMEENAQGVMSKRTRFVQGHFPLNERHAKEKEMVSIIMDDILPKEPTGTGEWRAKFGFTEVSRDFFLQIRRKYSRKKGKKNNNAKSDQKSKDTDTTTNT